MSEVLSRSRERLVRTPSLRTVQDEARSATWTELFFDLVYVAAVSRATTILAADRTAHGLAWFAGIMLLIVWSWTNFVIYTERFDTDDVVHRLLKAFAMSAVAGVALFAPRAATTGTFEFALSYLLVRVAVVALYARAFRHVVEARHPLAIYLAGFSLSAVLWAASLAASDEARPAVWAAAVVVELATPLLGWRGFGEHAFDLGHLSERFGQFMLIVLGEAVLGIVTALSNVRFHPAVVVSAAAAGVIVFCLWWHNFDFLQRRVPHGSWTVLYVYGATPVFIAVAAFGVTLDVAIQDAARPLAALVRWIASGALATYLVVPTAIQLGGTALELDPATVSRLVAAAALLGLAAAGGALASDVFLLLTAVVAVIQLGIEVTLTAAGTRNDEDDER